MSVSNQDEKTDNNDDGLQDLGIPVPIQTYLWGQLAPFIRPKLGKLHEAACMVNIHNVISYFGLSLSNFCSKCQIIHNNRNSQNSLIFMKICFFLFLKIISNE